MQRALIFFLIALRIDKLWKFLNRNSLVILVYHGFTERTSFGGIENHQGMHLNTETFRRQLEYLAANYHVITLADAVAHLRNGTSMPRHSVVITQDDGYESCYGLAYPIMKEFNLPATIFVTTDPVSKLNYLWHDRVEYALNTTAKRSVSLSVGDRNIHLSLAGAAEKLAAAGKLFSILKNMDQRLAQEIVEQLEQETGSSLKTCSNVPAMYGLMDWDQVVEMDREGLVSIGVHTKTHAILSRCGQKHLKEEVCRSKQVIEEKLGHQSDLFCYPNGAAGDFNESSEAQIMQAGFSSALTTVPGHNNRRSDLMKLKRYSAPLDISEFAITLAGLRPLLSFIRHPAAKLLGN